MSKYAYTGTAPGVLADGRPVAPGQRDISITAEDIKEPHNQSLLTDGVLQETTPAKASEKEASK
ncbi:MAG: hypothetical protein JWM31_1260 [Solirubrobacterales bacterium]|nr:hypothetical protein [Solirubrobacterales bacterium]